MTKKLITLLTIMTLTNHIYAGGKGVVPAISPIAEIPVVTEINPIPLYIGIGGLWAGLSRDCACVNGNVEEETYGGIIRAGYDFNQYVGIEARGLYSSIQKDIATTQHYGVYLKPMLPVGENMNVYGLIGYGNTQLDCIVTTLSYDKNSFSWGAGFEYDFSDKTSDLEEGIYDRVFDGHGDQEKGWGMWIDYQNLLRDSGVSNFNSNIVTAGITYDF